MTNILINSKTYFTGIFTTFDFTSSFLIKIPTRRVIIPVFHQKLWGDSEQEGDKFALCVWLMIKAHVEVMGHTEQEFQLLPKRWVVEITFGRFNQYHHLRNDYERLPK